MEAYSRLRPTTEKRDEKFIEYFEAGHNTSSATKECERNLGVPPSSLDNANAQLNSTSRTVRYWQAEWLVEKFGLKSEMTVLQLKKNNIYAKVQILSTALTDPERTV